MNSLDPDEVGRAEGDRRKDRDSSVGAGQIDFETA